MGRSSKLALNTSRRLYIAAMAALLVCLLALVVVTSVSTYRNVRTQVERELEQRLLSIGQTIAQGLGSARVTASTTADSIQQFAAVREDLRRIAAASDLGGIEVVDAKRRHLVGTDAGIPFGQKNPLLAAQPEVAVALAGIPVATSLYEAPVLRGTFFKTGFVPIEDPDGRILGVVAVEGGSGFFSILPALRRTWWVTGLASALIASVLAVLLFSVFRALERSERGLRATAALATAGQLAAVVAHEIRNPLAALQSRAERAQEDLEAGADPGEVAGLLEAIPVEVRRLDRIVTNYLSLARIAEGPGTCSVSSVIGETLDLVAKDLARAGIVPVFSAGPRELRARIDSGPLRQALLNLFLNAREAMRGGGELRVRLRPEGAWVIVEVEDTGRGIDPRTRRRIFEPFFTTSPTGSGLGLAVVDSIVRACGGRIEVRSEVDRGTTFALTLPGDWKGGTDVGSGGAVPDPPGGG